MLARISIRTQSASVSITTKNAKLDAKSNRCASNMKGNAGARVRLRTTPPKLRIDSTETNAALGRKDPLRQFRDYAAVSEQRGIQKIGDIAREGLEFLRVERGGNPIARQAAAIGLKDVQVTIAPIPLPEISFTQGDLQVSADINTLETRWQYDDGKSGYTPGKVTVSVAQYPRIEITVEPGVELHFPSPTEGKYVDTAT